MQQEKTTKRKREWDYNLSKVASGITGFVDLENETESKVGLEKWK